MIAVSGFFIFLLVWLCLPFVPGIIEIIKKTDAAPLKVVREYDVDVHYFSNVFRDYVKHHFTDLLSDTHAEKAVQGTLEDDTLYYIVNHNHTVPLSTY